MPLEFRSLSHGQVAFGFFNIETDLILLNQYFLFADDFCHYISRAAQTADAFFETFWEVFEIEPQNVGNLMGAIHGFDHSGFIGEVYKRFPFPKCQEEFKQNPNGSKNRSLIETMIQAYTKRTSILFRIDLNANRVDIGEYLFDRAVFQQLIQYVWRGGLPRWEDCIRPGYVHAMKEAIEKSRHPLFASLAPSGEKENFL